MLTLLDLVVIGLWLIASLTAGLWFSRRAAASPQAFFVSDRSQPWWVVGTSMVATTFAADTPLAVSGWVASGGIAKNWIWWTFGLTGSVAVFAFARLWRRARLLTDAELVDLRYGRSASWLRGAKAVWFGVFYNSLVMAWVLKAMVKILGVVLGWPPGATLSWWLGWTAGAYPLLDALPATAVIVVGLMVLTVVYTAASGLSGVMATDVLQFVLAMAGSLALGGLAWAHVGGLAGLKSGFANRGLDWEATTALVPLGDPAWDGTTAGFVVLTTVLWWSSTQVDGGGYLAQRLFSAKDDRHAVWAYLWFTVAHVVLRPWPWIVVGLVGMATLGAVNDPETYYPAMMGELLPAGLYGLMIASFLAAFMSTIDTQLHWGGSLMVNDLYRRFWRPQASDVATVAATRWAIVGLAVLGAGASFLVTDIGVAWTLAISITAGIGPVYVARWYWWRTNAWSELSAMITSAGLTGVFWVLFAHHPQVVAAQTLAGESAWQSWAWLGPIPKGWLGFPFSPAFTVLLTVPVWVLVTLWTAPAPAPVLRAFYQRVRPGGPGWRAIDPERAPIDGPGRDTGLAIVGSVVAIYGALLGVGWFITGWTTWSVPALALSGAGVLLVTVTTRRVLAENP